jgi:hypothetical protein
LAGADHSGSFHLAHLPNFTKIGEKQGSRNLGIFQVFIILTQSFLRTCTKNLRICYDVKKFGVTPNFGKNLLAVTAMVLWS